MRPPANRPGWLKLFVDERIVLTVIALNVLAVFLLDSLPFGRVGRLAEWLRLVVFGLLRRRGFSKFACLAGGIIGS